MTLAPRPPAVRRAFSLIELLVVIVIIAVVIGITIPALRGGRDASRSVSTRAMMTELVNACTQFETDQRRQPGYFTPRDLGNSANPGFSTMENVLLDLSGQTSVVSTTGGSPPAGNADAREVGPFAAGSASNIWVDPNLIGAASGGAKNYFNVDKKRLFIPTSESADGTLTRVPDLVDDFGNPVLAWAVDSTATQPVRVPGATSGTASNAMARLDSGAPSSGPNVPRAKLYWKQNERLVTSTGLGRTQSRNQDQDSFLGTGSAAGQLGAVVSLGSALGSPSAPYRDPSAPATQAPTVATVARGALMFHSAGADGVYLARRTVDPRARTSNSGQAFFPNDQIEYQLNFVAAPTGTLPANAWTDKDGKPTTRDLLELFDDLVAPAGVDR